MALQLRPGSFRSAAAVRAAPGSGEMLQDRNSPRFQAGDTLKIAFQRS